MQPMRFIVGSRDCDELGHLNVSGYIYYCNRAGSAFMRDIGWPPGQGNGGRRYSFAAVHVVSDYLAEVREGQAILVRAGVAKIGGKSVTFDNRITLEDGTPVFPQPLEIGADGPGHAPRGRSARRSAVGVGGRARGPLLGEMTPEQAEWPDGVRIRVDCFRGGSN
ncbi:acyl-CoA thioesterase [Jhaorihella thermophila]